VSELVSLFQLLMLPYAEFLEKLPLPAVHRFRAARGRLDAVIYRMIREHRERGGDQGDLLSMLMSAQEEDGSRMSDLQIRDEVMTLFLAGHETTSNALTWTWALLAQHPEVEEVFHAELQTALAGRPPTFDDLSCLPYTRAVLAESMRLYPPAWIVGRRVISEYEVGGYRIPEETVVIMSQAVMHRDPRWFPDPDRFDPARWLREETPPRPKFAYFPFGGGPRTCVGEQFAWMEGILLLATLGQKWKMRLDPEQRIASQPGITLRPRDGMRMFVEKRG
jgi:cytochrome P450